MNALARSMRAMMSARGDEDGSFCVSATNAFYELEGMRLRYHFSEFGTAGNIDSGGSSEKETREKLLSLLGPASVFYDIGAHEGLYTIHVKTKLPSSTVFAFEPHPEELQDNMDLNHIKDVNVFAVALGNVAGQVSMTTNKRSSNHVVVDGREDFVAMTTLDKVVLERACKLPTAIKLDIEGFEFNALKGAADTLRKARPIVVTEINDCFDRYRQSFDDFVNYMKVAGYQLQTLRAGSLEPVADTVHSISDLPVSADANYWWVPI